MIKIASRLFSVFMIASLLVGMAVSAQTVPPAAAASAWVQVGAAGFSAGRADFTSLVFDNGGTPYVAYQDGSNGNKASVMKYAALCSAITVTNNADSGAGSLQQAIADICDGGTITFDGDYTSRLTSEMIMGKNVTLDGVGHSIILVGPDAANAWTLTGPNDGSLGNISWVNIVRLQGGNNSDTLTGENVATTWNITGAYAGNLNGTFFFTSIENLTGLDGADNFVFADGMSFMGTIHGGGGADWLDYSALVTAVTVNLSVGTAIHSMGGVSEIENIAGGSAGDMLTGDNGNNIITGNAGGDIFNGLAGMDVVTETRDVDMTLTNNILTIGAEGADIFNSVETVALTGDASTNEFTVTASGAGFPATVNLSSSAGDDTFIVNLDDPAIATTINVDGGLPTASDALTINGADGDKTITVTDAEVFNGLTTIAYAGIESLNVNTGNGTNTVNVQSTAATTTVNSGMGDDNFTIQGTHPSSLNINSGSGADVIHLGLNDGTVSLNGETSLDMLIGPDSMHTWHITGSDTGDIDGVVNFTNIENLTGGANDDTFVFSDGAGVSGTIDGSAHTSGDALDYLAYTIDIAFDLAAGTATGTGHITQIEKVIGLGTTTITSSASNPTSVLPIPVTITFNRPVDGLSLSDFSVGNGTAGNLLASGLGVSPTYVQVGAGGYHTCGLASDGSLHCWGDNLYGQLAAPALSGGLTYKQVSAGLKHTCGLASDGSLRCWGDNLYGQLAAPALSSGLMYKHVSAGRGHTCGLVSDGSLRCWGTSYAGESTVPALSGGLTYKQVSAGSYYSCGLVTDGSARCWGYNSNGQINVTSLSGGLTYTQIAASGLHTCGLVSDGSLRCWGDNGYGQTNVPSLSGGLTYTQISAGYYHTCGLVSDGSMRCWGNTSNGVTAVTALSSGLTYTQVSAGTYHTCGLVSDGTARCWGVNLNGQSTVPSLPLSYSTYTATITPTAPGTVTVDLPANSVQSLTGAGNFAATQFSIMYAPPFNVTFDAQGGTPTPSVQSVNYGALVSDPGTSTLTSYTFDGWYTASSGGSKWNFATDTMGAGNMTLFAQWTINSYTVSFDTQGGSPASDNQIVAFGGPVTDPGTPARSGYTFNGWYTASSGGSQWNFVTDTMSAGNMTLFAQWTINSYMVSFNTQGGSPTSDNQIVAFGGLVTDPGASSLVGYTFSGWFIAPSGGSQWNFASDTMPANNMTLFAQWVDTTAPTVLSSVRVNPSPTNLSSVDFTVTFSETVTAVDMSGPTFSDFSLTASAGISGTFVSAVSGSGATYTVTVNTGSGNGTIRLNVVDDNSIVDAASNPLGGAAVGDGNFTTGAVYTITKFAGGDTTGVFRPSNGLLYLKNANTTGFADVAINYGTGGDYPVAGDWDGNGTATIGIYRNGIFYLRNSNTVGFADIVFAFGTPGDQPVAGDWDGDGLDTIGVYSNGQFLLRNSNSAGVANMSFYLGNPGDVGIAGDWNGDGMDTTGVFRPSNGIFFLKNANTTGFADIALNYGLEGDMPVTGDWNNDGIDTIGVYRNAQFLLRDSNTIGFADIVFGLGNPGGMPISGNWDGLP